MPQYVAIAGTGGSDSSLGGSLWSLPGNVTADDGTLAQSSPLFEQKTEVLVGTNYGFSIPANEVVTTVKFEVETSATVDGSQEDGRFYKGGVESGVMQGFFSGAWPVATTVFDDTFTMAELTAFAGITQADISTSGFGFGIRGIRLNAPAVQLQVDFMRVTVNTDVVTLVSPILLPNQIL